MTKSVMVRLGLGILFIVLFCAWYTIAANYNYGFLAGTYVFKSDEETCILYLHSDHTFAEELRRRREVRKSRGDWHRYGEAHVSFSKEFLALSGEEVNAEGQAHGQFDKTFGLFPILTLAPIPTGPRLYRNFFIRERQVR